MDLAKLSRLQRWILYAAYENRASVMCEPSGAPSEVDLYYAEVLAGYFGFPWSHWAGRGLREAHGAHIFDREAIGQERYNAAQASLSRAVRRLEARGLVERHMAVYSRWTGVRLLDGVLEAVSKLG